MCVCWVGGGGGGGVETAAHNILWAMNLRFMCYFSLFFVVVFLPINYVMMSLFYD